MKTTYLIKITGEGSQSEIINSLNDIIARLTLGYSFEEYEDKTILCTIEPKEN